MTTRKKPNPTPHDLLPPDRRTGAPITPAVDGGRFAVKRIAGDHVAVEAGCLADGHDTLACALRHRERTERDFDCFLGGMSA